MILSFAVCSSRVAAAIFTLPVMHQYLAGYTFTEQTKVKDTWYLVKSTRYRTR